MRQESIRDCPGPHSSFTRSTATTQARRKGLRLPAVLLQEIARNFQRRCSSPNKKPGAPSCSQAVRTIVSAKLILYKQLPAQTLRQSTHTHTHRYSGPTLAHFGEIKTNIPMEIPRARVLSHRSQASYLISNPEKVWSALADFDWTQWTGDALEG